MGLFENLYRRKRETVTLWGKRLDETADAGIADPAWIETGTADVVINELTPQEAENLAGGPVEVKLATLYCTEADGNALLVDDLIVTAKGKVWRVDGVPSQPGSGGHYEARLAFEPAPPDKLLNTDEEA